jgi:Asp-tRNA(Asn)/Glu-tRNA(Gln) amidotransferase A subunit family amidase
MALSWTQDRLGPLCRYAEDCAIVMATIARPDDRDMSVSDIPFNWNARQPIHTLRVGYLKDGFDETRDPVAKKNEEVAIAQVEKLGFRLVPVKVPDGAVDASGFSVESAVFFDELIRTGRDKQMTSPARVSGFRSARLIPAVEYLQAQRARTMMMMKLAEATADVDVYMVPANAGGGGGGRGGRGAAPADGTGAPVPPAGGRGGRGGGGGAFARSAVSRHFNMANLACYPAINVPNGFTDDGTPTALTFYARPFGEAGLLGVAKAYQDASGFHLKHPKLDS